MATISFKPNKKVHVLYHANCPDGTVSAAIVYKFYAEEYSNTNIDIADIEFYPASYGDEILDLDLLADAELYILDYSVSPYMLEQISKHARHIYFYDHHDTAIRLYEQYNFPDNVSPVLDKTQSGAGITWSELFSTETMPRLVAHVQDSDLWKFEIPNTRQILAGLGAIPEIRLDQLQYQLDEDNLAYWYNGTIAKGNTIIAYREQQIDKLVSQAYAKHIFDGNDYVLALAVNFNDLMIVSALGNKLAYHELNVSGIGIVWHYDGQEEKFTASVRSRKDVVCNTLAEYYGGGGHPQAAGFSYQNGDLLL